MDFRPRHFQGGMYVLFANLAEIVLVELERDIYLNAKDELVTRFPAPGPIALTNPLRRLSNMTHMSSPTLSGRAAGSRLAT